MQFLKMKIRTIFYRLVFKKFGKESLVYGRIVVYCPEKIEMGKFCTVNEGVLLNARREIKIGDCVHISPYCIINAGGLDYEKKMKARSHIAAPVIIEDGVWIGSGAIINPGVTIGKNSVIGAGAVVCDNIPANVVAVGVPAKVIKNI